MNDQKMDLPAWMDQKKDLEHQQSVNDEDDDDDEGQPLLFGTGSLPAAADKETQVDYGTTTATVEDDDNNDDQVDEELAADEPEEEEKKTSDSSSSKTTNKKKKTKTNKPTKTIQVKDDEISALTGGPPLSRPHIPLQNPLLWLFHLINGAAMIASFCLLMTQIIPFIVEKDQEYSTLFATLNLFLKFYISLFCIAFLLVETDVPLPMIRNSIIFQSFASRGFLYSFLGLVSTVESYSDRVQSFLGKSGNDNITWAAIFMQVSAWLMLAVGLTYFAMGVLCLQPLVTRMKEDEREQWREYRIVLKEWKRRQATTAA